MARATDRFTAEIKKSHTVYSYADIISPTQETTRLMVTDGSVNEDRTAQYRRSATMTVVDPLGTFVPMGHYGMLTPLGTEIRPYRGVKYDDGTIEVYPLGVFRLSKTTVTGNGGTQSGTAGVSYALEMYDRSRTISRAKFTSPYTVPAGTNLVTAIKLIIARTFPDAQYDSISTTMTNSSPLVYDISDDPWDAVTAIAQSIGCEIYFNPDGWVVIAPPADIDALPSPVFTYIENQHNTMTDLQTIYSDDPGFNGVIVTGASAGDELPPVRAVAWDTEPTSPTYYLGPYGQVPMFINDTNITTVADAQASANALLKGQIGFSSQLTVSSWVNPALESGDVIQVERASMQVTGLYTIDAIVTPLKVDQIQTVTLRQKRTVS
jgi:hypothetical protein